LLLPLRFFYGLARVRLDELSDPVFWLCRGVNDSAPFASFATWYGGFYDDIYESSVRLLESCETHEMYSSRAKVSGRALNDPFTNQHIEMKYGSHFRVFNPTAVESQT
jgi:hypothetical protein